MVAVDNVDLALAKGEVVGLLGPNGAGKTTIIKCALGLVRPTSGMITIAGYDVRTQHLQAIENASAVLEGARNIYWRMTPRENVRFFTGLHGLDPKANFAYSEELLQRFGLGDRLSEPVINLSTGMKQKVAVVCALVKQTSLVFLDEPTLGLDVETSHELRGILSDLARETGRTIMVSSHDMGVIQDICERVVIIKTGRVLADDKVRDLLALFGTRAYRVTLSDGLGEENRRRLEATVSGLALERRGGQTDLQFSLPSAGKLYEVIDVIRETGAVIEAISQKEPDLEETYLKVIRGGEEQ